MVKSRRFLAWKDSLPCAQLSDWNPHLTGCWKLGVWQVEDLIQPFNALSYVMVARYAVQATAAELDQGLQGQGIMGHEYAKVPWLVKAS